MTGFAALALLAAQPVVPAPPPDEDIVHICRIERSSALGGLEIEWTMEEDGSDDLVSVHWSSTRDDSRPRFSMFWVNRGWRVAPPDNPIVQLSWRYPLARRRIELRRIPDTGDRAVRMYTGAFADAQTDALLALPLAALRDFARGASVLEVRLVEPDGTVLAINQMNPALADALPPLLDGLQEEVDATRAAYRERCWRNPHAIRDIVI